MKFNIKDFAKIKEANVEIKGITVIAGENNTGKSTVGKALYSMYTAFHDLDDKVLLERKKAIMRSVYFDNDKSIRHQSIGSIGDIVKALLFDEVKSKDDIIERFKDANIVIDDNVADKIYTTLKFDKIHLEELVIRNIFNEEFNNQILPLHNENVNSVLELFVKDKQISVKFNNKETQFNKNIDLYYDGIYIDNPFILDQIYINENEEESIDDIYFKLIYDYRKAYNHKVTLQKKLSKSLKKKIIH